MQSDLSIAKGRSDDKGETPLVPHYPITLPWYHRVIASPRRLWPWLVWIGVLLGTAVGLGMAQAQGTTPARAGLVIQLAVDRVVSLCVDLGDDGVATGEEVLRASGLPLKIEYTPGIGGAVCKIDNQGCDFPTTSCFCECTLSPGVPCRYWSYNQLVNDRWRYASQGTTNAVVHAGEVEGWAWGEGTVSSGAQPPVKTFNELCAQQQVLPTNTTVAAPTSTSVLPTVSSTATVVPRVAYLPVIEQQAAVAATATIPTSTATRTPTAQVAVSTATRTVTQTPANQDAAPTATRQASATAQAAAPVIVTPSPQAQAPSPTVADTTAPQATGSSTVSPTSVATRDATEPPATALIATSTATKEKARATSAIAPSSSPLAVASSSPTVLVVATPTIAAVAANPANVEPSTGAVRDPAQQPLPSTGGTIQEQPSSSDGDQARSYAVFGALVLALALGWLYFQRKRRS